MFNPYSVRPIGSTKYEEYLMDIQTAHYYGFPEWWHGEDTPIHEEGLYAKADIPKPDDSPWTQLMTAIIASSMLDYCEFYRRKLCAMRKNNMKEFTLWESRCLELENEYFRFHPGLGDILDKLLSFVCWLGEEDIEKCQRRLRRLLRWTKS